MAKKKVAAKKAAKKKAAPKRATKKTAPAAPPPEPEKEKHAGGRPTKYRKEFDAEARRLCRLFGATDKELAEYLEVDPDTIYAWKNAHPSFAKAVRLGKVASDAKVAERLYMRAIGYRHKAVKIFQHEGASFEHQYTEHYPPDTAAGSLWLRNRQPAHWRDKTDHEHSGPRGGAIPVKNTNTNTNIDLSNVSPEEAARIYRELIKQTD